MGLCARISIEVRGRDLKILLAHGRPHQRRGGSRR